MEKGITYMVRPAHGALEQAPEPRAHGLRLLPIFVGPASSRVLLQMKVCSSTRATSVGSDQAT